MVPFLLDDSNPADRHGDGLITTPAGSTIEPVEGGGYRICDARSQCRRAGSLWEAQQLVHWAEVHHRPFDPSQDRIEIRS